MYYLTIENGNIIGASQCLCGGEGIQSIEVTEEIYNAYVVDNLRYIWNGSEVIENPEYEKIQLDKAKAAKITENDTARDTALNAGVEYKGVCFDSDTDQKINLLAVVSAMNEDDTITWFGMDNQPLECTVEDLQAIGGLITQLHQYCWNKNAQIKLLISEAETIEDLERIEIDYELPAEVCDNNRSITGND